MKADEFLFLQLNFRNQEASSIRLCVEPWCEFYEVLSGQLIEICVHVKKDSPHPHFSITKTDNEIIVFSPGTPTSFLKSYVMSAGELVLPLNE